jgi:tetratricopeptide repeat protein 30
MAKEALIDMPLRKESDLDPITLHNDAILYIPNDASVSFDKLHYLLAFNPCPPETFGNLLLLYVKREFYDLAADLMAQYSHECASLLDPFIIEFVTSLISKDAAPNDSFKRLDELGSGLVSDLRKLTKVVQDSKLSSNEEIIKKAVSEYEDCLDKYLSVVTAEAKIFWDMKQYYNAEKTFRRSIEFCGDDEDWQLRVAHVLFIQEKYKEACNFYEPVVKKKLNSVI